MRRKSASILLFQDIEGLDFCRAVRVFTVTRLNEEKRREELSPFNVFLVPSGGMRVLPDFDLVIVRG